MKIIYFGTASFAVPTLRSLADEICLVVSQPDRPGGRGLKIHSSPVKEAALELGLAIETPEKSRAPEFVDRLRSENADVLVVAAYGQILSQKVLDSATRGGINLHGSILPKYRGAAPIQRCILDGETETGVTLMQMDRGMDTGDIIEIARTPIGPDENYGELQDRLAIVGAELAVRWLPSIVAGNYPRTAQDNAAFSHAPKIEKSEAELRFDRPAKMEFDRYRAFTPAPGSFLLTRLGPIRISRAKLESMDTCSKEPGTVVKTSPSLVVSFDTGAIAFEEIQPEGKKRMRGSDFANGARLHIGDRLI